MIPPDLVADLLKLDLRDRAELADVLLDSLDDEAVDEDVATAWSEEIERRAGRIQAGEAEVVDGPTAMAQIRERLRSLPR